MFRAFPILARIRSSSSVRRREAPIASPHDNEAVRATLESLIALRREAAGLGLSGRNQLRTVQSGASLSTYRGRGMDFEEVRIYQPGDDIRTMDWRVTARTGEPHTKIYREERERPVLFLVDQGASMHFGTRVRFKSVTAARTAALLAWAVIAHNDRVGGIVFAGEHRAELRPTARRQGVLRLCKAITEVPPATATARQGVNPLNEALLRLSRITRPGSVIFVLSDFRSFDDASVNQLGHLSRHAELISILIHDPVEAIAPPAGLYPITDGESFFTLDTASVSIVRAHRSRFAGHLERVRSSCRRHGARFMSLATDEPLTTTLRQRLATHGVTLGQA